MINSRNEIKEFILNLENRFPVNEWQLNGFYFWPIIRIRLFFHLIRTVENTSTSVSNVDKVVLSRSSNKIKGKLNKLVSMLFAPIWFARLPKKKFIFIAQDAHRVNYEGKRYNRFFDILIDKYGLENDSLYFEKTTAHSKKVERNHLLRDYDKALAVAVKRFRMKKIANHHFENEEYKMFLSYLEAHPQTKDFVSKYTEKKLSKWYSQTVVPKILFFKKVLRKIAPEQIMILCYYSENIMLLLSAANQLNIKTIEMQHGPQSPLHLCYANWGKVPNDGYSTLPKTYWCWDLESKNTIDEWAKNTQLYSAEVIGNPWVDFWKDKTIETTSEPYILYSLQPKPVSIELLFSDEIIALIKELGMQWFIRLHPRQLNDLDKIKALLEEQGVLSLVTIEEATELPLPQLLSNAILHVTHYSGTAIEASEMQTFTILLHSIGAQSFEGLISARRATYLNPKDSNFSRKFKDVLGNTTKNELAETRYSSRKELF